MASRAQVSVALLSLIERGKRQPSVRSWRRIREALGIAEPLPRQAWEREVGEIAEEVVAILGACLVAVREARLAELAEASGASIAEVRLALRRLAGRVEPAGMQVLDDGNVVQLAPLSRFGPAVRQLTEPLRHPGLTPDQAEVLAIVIAEAIATRSHIEDVRGFSQSRVGPEGVTMIPRDCSETLALLVSRGLLAAERDDNALGLPNVYRTTPQLLQAFGVQTLEQLRERMGITKPPGADDLWVAEDQPEAVGVGGHRPPRTSPRSTRSRSGGGSARSPAPAPGHPPSQPRRAARALARSPHPTLQARLPSGPPLAPLRTPPQERS